MIKTVLIGLLALILFDNVHSQIQKRLRRDDLFVKVRATVIKLPGDYLRFHYLFESVPTSRQSIHRAIVELNDEWTKYGGSVRNVISPKEKDWGEFPTVGEKMWWYVQYDTAGKDDLRRVPINAVLPGERLSFSFEAKGLPGVGQFWAAGWAPWFFSEEEHDSLLREGYPESDLHATDDKFFRGYTIVRRTPPSPFVSLVFLDTLISYKHQAAALGWLKDKREDKKDEDDEDKDDTVVRKLDKRLEKVRRELVKGDSAKAREELQKFVKKIEELYKESVEAEKKKEEKEKVVMTSEAYALLKFNAEYLIDRLPKKKEKDDDD